MHDILENYDNIVRPVPLSTDAVKLSLGLKLSQISDIVNYLFSLFYFNDLNINYLFILFIG
jgi:hypothetical protein